MYAVHIAQDLSFWSKSSYTFETRCGMYAMGAGLSSSPPLFIGKENGLSEVSLTLNLYTPQLEPSTYFVCVGGYNVCKI